ncbi:unnamed protein product [Mycena citricolor]|uniref:Glycosyltransferase family 32 protein n=1 Tax=Mycena citricolor TaxID=2018698 RepID=A0AAD2HTM7_9AGAR|nr:unnamed protein product [Mycena citricolor]
MIPTASAPHSRPHGRPLLPKQNFVNEKYHKRHGHTTWISVPLSLCGRRSRLFFPNPSLIYLAATRKFGRIGGVLVISITSILCFFTVFALSKRLSGQKKWPGGESPKLVFKREDLAQIWKYEVASGHHPSCRSSECVGISSRIGAPHVFLEIAGRRPNTAYPPRPVLGSCADFDLLIEYCDFSENKYVRDCLELLRLGGGLDTNNRVRRNRDPLRYVYIEDSESWSQPPSDSSPTTFERKGIIRSEHESYLDEGFTKSRHNDWEPPIIPRPPAAYHRYSRDVPCDRDDPRIFHIYWTGPFTDKPYLTLLSFLYTQNTGLHFHGDVGRTDCSPQLWIWINPSPAAKLAENVTHNLREELESNPWSAPFLHPRFQHAIQFKLWNTTEQLDGLQETRDDWSKKKTLFKSGGHIVFSSGDQKSKDISKLTGSVSPDLYDRLSVIMSDMARFLLCHKYGGIYVDADTAFLRDWEELWGYKGAFAYRWSFHDAYNTAVLRLRKNSLLGHFLIRTAVKNGFDFHPFEITKYLKEGRLEGLLARLPDALFDPAWLNMEGYQRDRPPQPHFDLFEDFFDTPSVSSGAPLALGFTGFFSGAYSYHFHNNWWSKVDSARNWPDLGPNFPGHIEIDASFEDERDLNWSTVLKRTFEAYIRGEIPNMYGEWIAW